MGDIAQRGNRLTFAKGGRAGFSIGSRVGRHLKKGTELIKEHVAKKEAKKVQAGKDKIQKSEMGYAKGGRIGKKWGKIVRPTRSRIHEMLGGGEKGKPHSTKEGRQASGKRLLRRTYEAAKEHVKSTAKKDTESVKDVR